LTAQRGRLLDEFIFRHRSFPRLPTPIPINPAPVSPVRYQYAATLCGVRVIP
jgi:hypothetical protein